MCTKALGSHSITRHTKDCAPCIVSDLFSREWDIEVRSHQNPLPIEIKLRDVLIRREQDIDSLLARLQDKEAILLNQAHAPAMREKLGLQVEP